MNAIENSPLAQALADFNRTFDMAFRLPIWPEHVESAATYAGLRGRNDIAEKLRAGVKQTEGKIHE